MTYKIIGRSKPPSRFSVQSADSLLVCRTKPYMTMQEFDTNMLIAFENERPVFEQTSVQPCALNQFSLLFLGGSSGLVLQRWVRL